MIDKETYRKQPPLMCPSCFRQEFMRTGAKDKRKYVCAFCDRVFDGMRTDTDIGARLKRISKTLQRARLISKFHTAATMKEGDKYILNEPVAEAYANDFQQWLEKVEA